MKRNYLLLCVQIIGILIVAASIFGWFYPSLFKSAHFERPLSKPRGLAIDRQGRIYCGIPPYSRIQVYSPNGTFIDSWPFQGTSTFRIRVNDLNQLEVADRNRDHSGDMPDVLYVYNLNGTLIRRTVVDDIWKIFGEKSEYELKIPSGDILSIPNKPFSPRIELVEPSGTKITTINNSLINWLIMAPFPVFLWLIVGGILILIASKLKNATTS